MGSTLSESNVGSRLSTVKKETNSLRNMMSGASGTKFNIKSGLVASNTAIIAKSLGCTDDPDSSTTLECLRKQPLETLTNVSVSLSRRLRPPFGELSFYPSFDGD